MKMNELSQLMPFCDANGRLTALPATFMSAVSCTYILMAKEGFQLSTAIAYPAGIIFAAVCLGTFVFTCVMGKGKNADSPAVEEPYGV